MLIAYTLAAEGARPTHLNARNPDQWHFTSVPTDLSGTSLNNMTSSPLFGGYGSAHSCQAVFINIENWCTAFDAPMPSVITNFTVSSRNSFSYTVLGIRFINASLLNLARP
jgi:hypothetical protein